MDDDEFEYDIPVEHVWDFPDTPNVWVAASLLTATAGNVLTVAGAGIQSFAYLFHAWGMTDTRKREWFEKTAREIESIGEQLS